MIDKARAQQLIHSPKTRKYGLRVFFAFVIVGVLGFFVLPPIVKSHLLEQLGQTLHRPVAVKNIRINPYALSVTLEGVVIQEPEGGAVFASFDSLYLNVDSTSLFRRGLVLGEVRLVNPLLRIVRLTDKRYNFSDLVDEFAAKPASSDPAPSFSINNIQLSGGAIEFDDRPVDEKHTISHIGLTLPFVSNMAYATDSFVEPSFSARFNGAPLAIKGKSKPFARTLESELALDLDELKLANFLDYSPVSLPVKMHSGELSTRLKLVFRQEENKPSTLLLSGNAAIRNLKVDDASDAPLVSLKQLDLSIASADLLNLKFVVDRLAIDAPLIDARVSRQGRLNWIEFFRQELATGQQAAQPAVNSAPAIPSPSLEWALNEVKVTGGAVRWFDESNETTIRASVEAIEFGLTNLDSKATQRAHFEMGWRMIAEEWLKIDAFSIKGGQLDLARRELVLGEVSSSGANGLIRRKANGRIEWLKPPLLRALEKSQEDRALPWKVTIASYSGDNIGLRFEDQAVSPAAMQRIDGLSFKASNLSTEPGQVAQLSTNFMLNRKGSVIVSGKVQPFPLNADLNLAIKALDLLPLQPYFSEKLNIAVTRGQLTVDGAVLLRQAGGGKSGAVDGISGGFAGKVTVGDFYAVDKLNSADFLRWKSFYLSDVDVRLNPDSVSIGEVALSDFFARVIVSPEGKLNLLQIVRKDETVPVPLVPSVAEAAPVAEVTAPSGGSASTPLPAAEASTMPVKVGKITLQGGTVRFTDNFIKPNYTANLKRIGGRVTGLSSQAGTVASLELRGQYENVAPLSVTAQINPLSAKPYLDLQGDIKGIEMTSFSSYSGKYAGYAIEKGKLSLSVKYTIENDQLEAENRIFLDQLTFGEPVESPDATKLPVTLAVSLLKNRNGEIDINLPISGSLNDPEFSIGGLVIKVIFNLFAKAVTSPFALLGSMFGGGEELSNVEFDFGRAVITPAAEQRLDNLAKALIDRPALKLEITGRVDPENDREGLKRARIDRKVRALKREDLTRKSVESGSAETVEVSPQDYPALLEKVYRAENFPKPRTLIGMIKSLPVEEMEKLILANSVVDNDDLLGLGERRAKAVQSWLVDHQVPAERIFLLPSKLSEDGSPSASETKARASRVDFSLR